MTASSLYHTAAHSTGASHLPMIARMVWSLLGQRATFSRSSMLVLNHLFLPRAEEDHHLHLGECYQLQIKHQCGMRRN